MTRPPADPETLIAEIVARHNDLSKRLKQIARFALDHRNEMALETIAVLAQRAGVQPSALVRFAKSFGYRGFSEMQRVFRVPLVSQGPDYGQRIKAFHQQHQESHTRRGALAVLEDFVAASMAALARLPDAATAAQVEQAVTALAAARELHVIGQRRAFPVAAYLAYALSHLDLRVHLIDGIGGMVAEQVRPIGPSDALLAISFQPYSNETVRVVNQVKERGATVVAISDSQLSPVASAANIGFTVADAEVHGLRSLSASLGIAQCLVIGLAYRLEQQAPT